MSRYISFIYKNGSEFNRNITICTTATISEGMQCATAIVYLNGSTDYIEVYAQVVGTQAYIYGGGITRQFVTGCLLRTA